jgi:SecD/SecF fusion protein
VSGGLRWKLGSVAALVLLFAYLTVANFVPKPERVASPLLPDDGLRLGLDLQGGIHWVVGVELDEAVKHELGFLKDSVESALKEEDVSIRDLTTRDGRIRFFARTPEDAVTIREVVGEFWSLEVVEEDGLAFELGLTGDKITETRENTMSQVLEVLRKRIDDPVRGIPDSVVTRQGTKSVLVQIPGGQIDRERARGLLKSTGFLEFKIVADAAENEELLRARHPDGLPAATTWPTPEWDSTGSSGRSSTSPSIPRAASSSASSPRRTSRRPWRSSWTSASTARR